MVFVPSPGKVQVEMVYTSSGQPCENVYHVDMGAVPTPAEMLALTNVFDTWDSTYNITARHTQTFLQKIVCRDLSAVGAPSVENDISPTRAGTGTGPPLPNNVTLALEWRTGFSGRSYRGRTYIIGLMETALGSDAQEVTSSFAGNILTVYDHLLTSVNAVSGHHLVVLSRYQGVDPTTHRPIPRAAGVATPITNVVLADPFIDSQRRRLPNHNRHR